MRKRGAVFAAAILVPAIWLTHERNRTYQTELGIWNDTVQKVPYNVRGWVMLSMTQIGLNQTEAAIATMLQASRLMPDNAEFHNNAGVYLYRIGRLAEATAQLREAIRLKPDYISAYSSLGRVLLDAGDAAGAAEAFEALLRIDPANAKAHNYLGVILARTGRPAEAIPHFEAALKTEPELREAQTNLEATRQLIR
jgi:Tfp pilus assembly protein PilF